MDVFGDQTRKFQSQLVQQFAFPNNNPKPVMRAPDNPQNYHWSPFSPQPLHIVPIEASEDPPPQILHVPAVGSFDDGDSQVVLVVEGPVQQNSLEIGLFNQ